LGVWWVLGRKTLGVNGKFACMTQSGNYLRRRESFFG